MMSQFSIKKANFMRNPNESLQMSACEIEPLTKYHKNKHDITIIKNGTTRLGYELISKNKENILIEYKKRISMLEHENTKYYQYASHGLFSWLDNEPESYQSLKRLLEHYLEDDYYFFRDNLNQVDIENINNLIKSDPVLKESFDAKIEYYLSDESRIIMDNDINTKINNCCLTLEDANQEIASIQKELNDNQAVGYVYTNGNYSQASHFEVIIISKNEIIKPLSWNVREDLRLRHQHDDNQWSKIVVDSSVIFPVKQSRPLPQSDKKACGTLAFLYLKELLKNDCLQLNEYTLRFPVFEGNKETWLFFPSPHVLRYSQSSKFNTMILDLLSDSTNQSSNTDQIVTLKKILEDSIQHAKVIENTRVINHNANILENLPRFCEKWLAEYSKAMKKRETMDHSEQNINLYLAYSTHSLFNKQKTVTDTGNFDKFKPANNLNVPAVTQ